MKLPNNPIGWAAEKYRKIVPNPLQSAALLGLIGYGATSLAWDPIVDTVEDLGRPLAAAAGTPDGEWDRQMYEFRNSSAISKWGPRLAGLAAFLAHVGMNYRDNEPYMGQLSWTNPVKLREAKQGDRPYIKAYGKTASLHRLTKRAMADYASIMEMEKRINAPQAIDLFKSDPHLDDKPYVRNMGTAIVQHAAQRQGSDNPTLGNVFDSAMNKIGDKLTFSGIQRVGLRTVVQNQLSRMFTGTIGAMMDLSPSERKAIQSAGTWAGAVSAILD